MQRRVEGTVSFAAVCFKLGLATESQFRTPPMVVLL